MWGKRWEGKRKNFCVKYTVILLHEGVRRAAVCGGAGEAAVGGGEGDLT